MAFWVSRDRSIRHLAVPRAAEVENALKTAPSLASPGFYLPQHTLDFNAGIDGQKATSLFDFWANETYFQTDNEYNGTVAARTWALAQEPSPGYGNPSETTYEFGGYVTFSTAFGRSLVRGDDVYGRVRLYFPAETWVGASPYMKTFRIASSTGHKNDFLITTGTSGYNFDPGPGGWFFSKEGVLDGPDGGGYLLSGPITPVGSWHTWEFFVHFHESSGVVRLFKDGVLVREVTGCGTLDGAGETADGFMLFTYYNAVSGAGRPATDRHVDIEDISLSCSDHPPPIRNNGFRMIDPGV